MEFKELIKYIEENKEEHFDELIKKIDTKINEQKKSRRLEGLNNKKAVFYFWGIRLFYFRREI
ncbi:hypothetical protein [Bacillus paranthracis]|nr:hypothetical protein [Bacillus paranthracis]MED1613403.1 hypothetical protein [Bacillus paranthracis]MED1684402.1 hypothetical protein [Bacillus paranthracis]